MKTKTIKLYDYKELSADAQRKALNELYDINVFHEWWDSIYDDAKTIGIVIQGFDIDRGNFLEAKFEDSMEDIAKAILEHHGKDCDTYKLAQAYLDERAELYKNAVEALEDGEDEDDIDTDELFESADSDFQYSLREEYLSILRKDYEYLTSDEAIIETIESNEYTFTENGKMENL